MQWRFKIKKIHRYYVSRSEEKYNKSSNNSSILSLNQLLANGIDSKKNIPSDRGNQRSFTRGDKKDKREQRDSEDKRRNLPEQIFLHLSVPCQTVHFPVKAKWKRETKWKRGSRIADTINGFVNM